MVLSTNAEAGSSWWLYPLAVQSVRTHQPLEQRCTFEDWVAWHHDCVLRLKPREIVPTEMAAVVKQINDTVPQA